MMSDGVVSIGDGKFGNEASPTRRRSSTAASTNASAAPLPTTRVKRSPQGSVAGESSTKGSERDEMEEVSNEEGQWCPCACIQVYGSFAVSVRLISCFGCD